MATLAGLTQETLRLLYGGPREERPVEDTITADGTTTITFATDSLWRRGDYAEFDDGEIVILQADASGATAVGRAQRGSTQTAHSLGDRVVKNPLYPRVDIEQFITDVIEHELWPDVWMWHQGSQVFTAPDHTYEMPQYVEDIDLIYQISLDGNKFLPLPTNWWGIERQVDATVSSTGTLLRIRRVHASTEPVLYTARRRPLLADIANMSDEVASLIPWAAAAKATATRSVGLKADPSGNVRLDEGGLFRDYRVLRAEFELRRDGLRRKLLKEVRRERQFVPAARRGW